MRSWYVDRVMSTLIYVVTYNNRIEIAVGGERGSDYRSNFKTKLQVQLRRMFAGVLIDILYGSRKTREIARSPHSPLAPEAQSYFKLYVYPRTPRGRADEPTPSHSHRTLMLKLCYYTCTASWYGVRKSQISSGGLDLTDIANFSGSSSPQACRKVCISIPECFNGKLSCPEYIAPTRPSCHTFSFGAARLISL